MPTDPLTRSYAIQVRFAHQALDRAGVPTENSEGQLLTLAQRISYLHGKVISAEHFRDRTHTPCPSFTTRLGKKSNVRRYEVAS